MAIEDVLDDGAQIAALMLRFYPGILRQSYQDAGDLLSVTITFDLENERVQETLGSLAKLVRGVADTTRDQIRDLVGQAAREGWSTDQLSAAIRDQGVTESKRRADLIARTESASAYSQGSLLAFQESGVVSGVEWLTAADEVCPICEPLNGRVADLGGAFEDDVSYPPAHPGCRCALAPVVA